MTQPMVLTTEQNAALSAFFAFMSNPAEPAFVLTGFSGTGKSTLVRTMLDQWPDFQKTLKLVSPKQPQYEIALTATTNKAAENLAFIAGQEASTIHSFLGLRVDTNFKTGEVTLVPRKHDFRQENKLVFIDEASYVDSALLTMIFQRVHNCKVVFIGDPAQLTPVKTSTAPVFKAGFPGAALTQVVRQAEGNPIVELSTLFRNTVNTGEFFSFKPDGSAISHVNREDFHQEISNEFNRPDWKFRDSKVLGWTNKCVIAYNNLINDSVKGTPDFQVGDYAVCNKFLTAGRSSIKTDQLVQITSINYDFSISDVLGNMVVVDNAHTVFLPKSREARNARLKRAKAEEDYALVEEIENRWVDLRAAYAQTINKAQGSTYDTVFIDLDDLKRCNSGNQLARMLYVGVSRARHRVVLTGDIIAT